MNHQVKLLPLDARNTTQIHESIIFDFQTIDTNLIINAYFHKQIYSCIRHPVPEISYDSLKEKLQQKEFTITDCNYQTLELKICGFYALTFQNHDLVILMELQNTTKSLKEELDGQKEKNAQLQALVMSQQYKVNSVLQQLSDVKNNQIKSLTQMILKLQKSLSLFQTETEIANQEAQQKTIQSTAEIQVLKDDLALLKRNFDHIINQNILKKSDKKTQFFNQSKVVCSQDEKLVISNFFDKKIKHVNLLYRASDHNFSVKTFHEKCDGVPKTLTVIQTEFDKKIGGFTPQKWSSKSGYAKDNLKESFIFSLTHNDKFTLQEPEKAIYNDRNCGPSFGGGHDISVDDKADQQSTSYVCINHSYKNEQYSMKCWKKFHGGSSESTKFMVKEWEVWAVE